MTDEGTRGPMGDVRPDADKKSNITPSLKQERPEDRENVSIVKPEDYPLADRELANVANISKSPKAGSSSEPDGD